jgi:glycosyltransferase involved in cell wall biosynthesis
MPKVSVAIPTYNRAHFIAEAIQSVIDQSFQDFEIIIIDDGSTDKTKEIVSAFPVRYYWQENQGVAAACNRAISLCQGEYIKFLGSDDVLLKKALEKGVQVLDKHPAVAFSYSQAYLMDENGRIFRVVRQHERSYVREGSEEIGKFIIRGNYIVTPTHMARRSCLIDVGLYNPAFRYGSEDLDLFVRLAKKYAVAYIAEPLVKIRSHSGSIQVGRRLEELEETHRVILEGVFNDPKLGAAFSPQRPRAYYYLYSRLAEIAYGRGEMRTARHYLSRALKNYPKLFSGGLWLSWTYQFAKTWLPQPILDFIRYAKRFYFRMTNRRLWHQSQTIGLEAE